MLFLKCTFYLLTLASDNIADTLMKQRTSSMDFSNSIIHQQSRDNGHTDYTYNFFYITYMY